MTRCRDILWSIFAALLLSSCGFHLRGVLDMPNWLTDVSIVIQKAHRDLSPELKEQLEVYHIRVLPNRKNAHYLLVIEQDIEEQNITSVSSSTTPRQYQMTYAILFKLQDAKGKDIIPLSKVTATRQVTINSDRILGSNYEETLLLREMRHDAIIQILDRLGHASL